MAFVKALSCLISRQTPSENAHAMTGGMGRKADAKTIVPLAAAYHRELHQIGVRSFEAKYATQLDGRPLAWWANHVEGCWQWHTRQPVSLSAIVHGVVADAVALSREDAEC